MCHAVKDVAYTTSVLGHIGAAHSAYKCSQILSKMVPTSDKKHLYDNLQLIIIKGFAICASHLQVRIQLSPNY